MFNINKGDDIHYVDDLIRERKSSTEKENERLKRENSKLRKKVEKYEEKERINKIDRAIEYLEELKDVRHAGVEINVENKLGQANTYTIIFDKEQ